MMNGRDLDSLGFLFEHEYSRAELNWLGSDAEGSVGIFWTAGTGPVPAKTLTTAAIEVVFIRVQDLLVTGEAIYSPGPDDGDVSEWMLASERGLFAYDWDRTSSRYRLIASPSASIGVRNLPTDLREQAELSEFPFIFSRTSAFSVSDPA